MTTTPLPESDTRPCFPGRANSSPCGGRRPGGDRNAYGISHVGWGLHERALWHALSRYEKQEMIGVDGRAFEGSFLLSTDPNRAAGRHTLCPFDIPMPNCSIFLDGTAIVIEGTIVEPAIRRS